MNTTGPPLARVGIGIFSVVLLGVVVLTVGGLLVADQALARAGGSQADIDATESGLVIDRLVATELARLDALGILFTSEPRDRNGEFTAIAESFAATGTGARTLWVADSAGGTTFDTVLATGKVPDTTALRQRAEALAMATRSGRPALMLAPGGDGRPDVLLVAPLVVRGRRMGVAGAAYAPAQLFAPLVRTSPPTRARLMLLAGNDTVVAWNIRHARFAGPKRIPLDLPTDVRWQLDVAHAEASQALRVTLWALGLLAVFFLSLGVLRERRQAVRVAERSTELERLSSELLRANRMKSEFLANVSHELRTPLNAIVGFVDLLRDGVYGDLSARQIAPVDRIAASATHLRHLVDQVLDIAKIAAGRLEVHAETVVLRPFVLNVASELESLIAERGLNLSIAVGASLPRVRTDPTHLRQILVNLIGNAVKYTSNGGVAVRARLVGPASGVGRPGPDDPALLARAPDRRKTWVALQVIDTGIGISPADQERIFDEFEQVNAGPRGDSMHRGTGLGLAISRRLARLLGGDITVESQLGKGSTFTLWLAVSRADLPGAESADLAAEDSGVTAPAVRVQARPLGESTSS